MGSPYSPGAFILVSSLHALRGEAGTLGRVSQLPLVPSSLSTHQDLPTHTLHIYKGLGPEEGGDTPWPRRALTSGRVP